LILVNLGLLIPLVALNRIV